MAPRKKTTKSEPDSSSAFKALLAANGLSGIIRTAQEMPDLRQEYVSTGFPRLDRRINPFVKGMPRGCDVEIYSRNPSEGKTSLALRIASYWQKLGFRIAILDLERTITDYYLGVNEIAMADLPGEGYKGADILMPYFIRPDKELYPVEKVLDAIKFLSRPAEENGGGADLIVTDSVAVMETQKNLERATLEDKPEFGGISKILTEYFRQNVAKRPTILWLNQAKQKMVQGTHQPVYATTGGMSVKFFSSLRLELTRVENIKMAGNDEESFGFKTKVLIKKNKAGKDNCSVTMTYVPGEGFSPTMDYIQMAQDLGLITKSGSWFAFGTMKVQGEQNLYYAFRNDKVALEELKSAVAQAETEFEGEDVSEEESAELAGVAED